jgi:hypothetical protein
MLKRYSLTCADRCYGETTRVAIRLESMILTPGTGRSVINGPDILIIDTNASYYNRHNGGFRFGWAFSKGIYEEKPDAIHAPSLGLEKKLDAS